MAHDPLKRLFNAAKQNKPLAFNKDEVRFVAALIQSASDQLQTHRAVEAMTGGSRRKALRAAKVLERKRLKAAKT